eukprot:5616211-Heterocapsa_arctica.AAC.1
MLYLLPRGIVCITDGLFHGARGQSLREGLLAGFVLTIKPPLFSFCLLGGSQPHQLEPKPRCVQV